MPSSFSVELRYHDMDQDQYFNLIAHHFPGANVVSIARLTGGVSADVHRIELTNPAGSEQTIVIRAHGASHSGHPAELEFRLLAALHHQGLPVAEPLFFDTSRSLIPNDCLGITFISGSTAPPMQEKAIDKMASMLAYIHQQRTQDLPQLPQRLNPLPEAFEFLPKGNEWQTLQDYLGTLINTGYEGEPKLLHGDFWFENLLWRNNDIVGVLDWEDAALGDPMSDLASARVELRYRMGRDSMVPFTRAYAKDHPVDANRLALWQIYVASAAQQYMGQWGLEPSWEAHMRKEALASVQEALDFLMTGANAADFQP